MNVLDGAALGHWIELALPDAPWPGGAPFVGFVYLDAQAGLSAKGGPKGEPTLTVRLPIGVDGRVIPDDEAAARGLADAPAWLEAYGAQPVRDAAWRRDPRLAGKWHKQFPDDLQVLVHDGEPGAVKRRPENCWVRVDAALDGPARPATTAAGAVLDRARVLYEGVLLSKPHKLTTYAAGDRVRFAPDPGGRHLIAMTAAYLAARSAWTVTACTGCGLTEGLEAPEAMAAARFPDADGEVQAFTAHCPLCGPPAFRMFTREAP